MSTTYERGTTISPINLKRVSEFDLSFIARGLCPVYGGCIATGIDPTPLKPLGDDRWLHLELGLTLQGEPPRDGEGYDYLKVI
jgi:hypothetical protein